MTTFAANPMRFTEAPHFDHRIASQAAGGLVFKGGTQPMGYAKFIRRAPARVEMGRD